MPASASHSLKVLLVEDSLSDAELLVRELERCLESFTWRRVDNLGDLNLALDEERPDVALVDLVMPSLDGAEVVKLLRARWHDLPIIVVSGIVGDADGAALMDIGASDYLLKDRLGRLGNAIGRALALERERERATALIEGQNDVLRGIATGEPLASTLEAIVRLVEAQAPNMFCSILRVEGGKVYTGAAPSLPDEWNQAVDGEAIGPKAGSCGTAAFLRAEVIVSDIATDPLWEDYREAALAAGLRACWSRPVVATDGRVLGVFALYYTEPRMPRADEYQLVSIGTGLAGVALQKARTDAAQKLASQVIADMGEGMMLLNSEFQVVDANAAFERMVGRRLAEVRGTVPMFIDVEEHGENLQHEIIAHIRQTGAWRGELMCRKFDGERFPALISVSTVHTDGSTHYCAVFKDLSESHNYEQRLAFLTRHDAVTQLANREAFNERLAQAIANARRVRCSVGVIVVDLDNFKTVNDSLSHEAGDVLLRSVAARLRDLVRDTDLVARLGGDEFAVLLGEVDAPSDCAEFAERMFKALREPFQLGEHEVYSTCSAGITVAPQDGESCAVLLSNADAAMYRAKAEGRNDYRFFSAEMNAAALENLTIASSLRQALVASQFVLHYQPRFDAKAGHMTGVEALIRWNHPERGMMPPGKFIPVAEETGLIGEIGEWALRDACRQSTAWQAAGHLDLLMSVNLSARQLQDTNFVARVEAVLAETGMPASRLELEITESMLMRDPVAAARTLKELAQLGIRVAIDDFGTGYSSLSYLKQFTLHEIKIDRSFVIGLPEKADDVAIVRAIVAVADSLGMRTVAEGVETDEQRVCLVELGCDELQGFLLGHPVPPNEIHFEGIIGS